MDEGNYADYFLKPQQSPQRRYEALRAVFVEELSLKEVSHQFGISYGTLRNWIRDIGVRDIGGHTQTIILRFFPAHS